MSKFLLMGLSASILVHSSAVTPFIAHEQHMLSSIVMQAQKDNYLPKDMTFKIHSKEEAKNLIGEYFLRINQKGHCEIHVTAQKNGDFKYVGLDSAKFRELAAPVGEKEQNLYKEFVTLHEASHCRFSQIEKPFIVKENPSLEAAINYIYKDSGKHAHKEDDKSQSFAGVYGLLNETFADAYAAIQLIKMHSSAHDNHKEDVLVLIQKVALQRHSAGIKKRLDGTQIHDTHFSVENILNPEILARIEIGHSSELQRMALEIANDSIAHVLVNTSVSYNIGAETVAEGVVNIIENMIEKNGTSSHLSSDSNISLTSSSENSYVFNMAQIIFKEIKAGQLPSYDNAQEAGLKEDILYKNILERIEKDQNFSQASMEYNQYIRKNFQPSQLERIDKEMPAQQIDKRLAMISHEFEINRLTPSRALTNMQKIRQESFSSPYGIQSLRP